MLSLRYVYLYQQAVAFPTPNRSKLAHYFQTFAMKLFQMLLENVFGTKIGRSYHEYFGEKSILERNDIQTFFLQNCSP